MPPSNPVQAHWFAAEIQPHEPALRAYLRRWLRSETDVDDVVQEVYVRLFRARKDESFSKAFIFVVARNIVRDLWRRSSTAEIVPITETVALPVLQDNPGVSELVSRRQELALLREAIGSLPERCREVFLLRKIQGLSQKEIAATLGITENTVETLVAKGAHRCADYFRKHGLVSRSPHER